jgi:hypothetical protein
MWSIDSSLGPLHFSLLSSQFESLLDYETEVLKGLLLKLETVLQEGFVAQVGTLLSLINEFNQRDPALKHQLLA